MWSERAQLPGGLLLEDRTRPPLGLQLKTRECFGCQTTPTHLSLLTVTSALQDRLPTEATVQVRKQNPSPAPTAASLPCRTGSGVSSACGSGPRRSVQRKWEFGACQSLAVPEPAPSCPQLDPSSGCLVGDAACCSPGPVFCPFHQRRLNSHIMPSAVLGTVDGNKDRSRGHHLRIPQCG